MTVMERTAYPRFKRIFSAKDLVEVYTPVVDHIRMLARSKL
jgi:hypothetical protein